MSHEHSHIQRLKHRWDQEDAERDELEEQARRKFLEQEAKFGSRSNNPAGAEAVRTSLIGSGPAP
jgi:hypothetical protein